MAGGSDVLERVRRRVPDQLDPESSRALVDVLGTAVPFDGWCLLGLDPVSLHRAFMFSRGGSEDMRHLARLEAGTPDVNLFSDLARARVPAGWLSPAHPDSGSSTRLHEYLRPQGITSELRLVLRERGSTWGALSLFRRGGHDFGDRDVAVATACAPALVSATRRHVARPASSAPALEDGLVLLDASDVLTGTGGAATAWLSDLVPGGDDDVGSDDANRVMFDTAQAARAGRRASFTRRTATGRWLTVSAMVVDDRGGVAVQLRSATARERLTLLARASGLTAREAEVLDRITQGLPTKQVASALGIGVWTVEDHLSSVYRKLAVRGRDELFALLIDVT